MNNISFKIIVASLSLSLLFGASLFSQNERTVIVKDQSGNPIAGAKVIVGEEKTPVITNDRGEFGLKIQSRTPVLVEAEGYDPQLIVANPTETFADITMVKNPFQMTAKDNVNVPFDVQKQRQIPGAVSTVDPVKILQYDQVGSFSEALNGRIPGLYGSGSIRQVGQAVMIVDGVPRTITDFNPQMIESITVLKDLSSVILYGPQAQNGVILITTKRGQPLKRELNFSVQTGMNKPIMYPKYLNAADFMTLNNEALQNDGLPVKYTEGQIDSTRMGANSVLYPDENYYNSTYLRNFSTFHNIVGEVSGGNDIAQYYVNVGWDRDNSLLNLGEGANERKDRINVRGNVNYKLTDYIKIKFDGAAFFNISKTPRYSNPANDFWQLASTLRPNNTAVLIPASILNDKALLSASKLIDNQYILGGTSQYQVNLYGELTRNGPREFNERLVEVSTGLDFDLKSITPGLTASAYMSFDMYSNFYADLMNTYAVYQPTFFSADSISKWGKYGLDAKVDQQTLSDMSYYRRNGVYGKLDYKKLVGDHSLNITALAYRDQYNMENTYQETKHLQFGIRANYMYKNKYVVELTGTETGSVKLYQTHPWAFSPAVALAWVASEEEFLKGNAFVNYLKARVNFALLNTDESLTNYWLANNIYTGSSTFYYNLGGTSNTSRNIVLGNPNVGFEKRMNFNIGFESMLADYKIGFEASYFYYKNYDVLTRRSNYMPIYYASLPYENYGSYQTQGVEMGLNYNTNIGELMIKVGGNLAYSVPKALVVDELNYAETYRKQANKSTDAMFGFVALGLFQDQAEIDNSPKQSFGAVAPGDIKYEDLNGDNIIDDRDQKMIGNSSARLGAGINMNLTYRNFDFFVLGTSQTGAERYFNNAYYWIYGDRKYSDVVWDRWTPATAATATYPRLTTLSNSNNFRNSTFWLYENNWFSLETAQLTFSFPDNFLGMKGLKVYARGNNLFRISKNNDKAQLNIGTVPQMRTVSFGLNVML